ncbi:hypothetical protein SDC9_75860 [bioreactor metagenome]|uniref:Uncharacterized protein n=1 Tax=bioreactor metagenome TaxID=1076179 RepID=A0A644YLN5_9ZZZZ
MCFQLLKPFTRLHQFFNIHFAMAPFTKFWGRHQKDTSPKHLLTGLTRPRFRFPPVGAGGADVELFPGLRDALLSAGHDEQLKNSRIPHDTAAYMPTILAGFFIHKSTPSECGQAEA